MIRANYRNKCFCSHAVSYPGNTLLKNGTACSHCVLKRSSAKGMDSTNPAKPDKLSSSLKERLKRCGRYHVSPIARPAHTQNARHCLPHSGLVISAESEISRTRCTVLSAKENTDFQDRDAVMFPKPNENGDCVVNDTEGKLKQDSNDNKEQVDSVCEKKSLSCDGTQCLNVPNKTSKVTGIRRHRLNFDDVQTQNCETDVQNVDMIGSNTVNDIESCVNRKLSNMDKSSHWTQSMLEKELAKKEEMVRKLKMVKMYRTKNDLGELQVLIDKWRAVSQQALQDLHSSLEQEPKPSLTQLIHHLGIDHQLLHFNADEDETFS